MLKINFLLNSVNDAHSLRRVQDFKVHGFDVKVYGFLREKETTGSTDANIVGAFANSLSYKKRISIYKKGIKKAFEEGGKDNLWYYLGLDVALFATFFSHNTKYIYEECDLTQTYISNAFVGRVLELIDKKIIRNSLVTIMTSQGFIDFHYGETNKYPDIIYGLNKLAPEIEQLKSQFIPHTSDTRHLKFAFVGGIRYKSLLSVARIISEHFPNHEFHFYGFVSPTLPGKDLPHANNIYYHGRFKSPTDLPKIYSNVDVLICTYDIDNENVRFAEPNKLYEAMYFACPIIVSKGTYLAKRVKELGIGTDVDPYDNKDVISAVHKIEQELPTLKHHLNRMERKQAVEDYSYLKEIKLKLKVNNI